MVKHKHHIIPQYEGGSEDPSNLVELTSTQHAMWHFAEWQRKQKKEDYLAWRGLAGMIGKEEIIKELQRLGFMKMIEARDAEKDEKGKSLYGKKIAERLHREKTKDGKSVQGIKNAERLHFVKDDLGRSVQGVKNAERLNSVKDDLGRSVQGVENAKRVNSLRYQCLVTGKISTPAGLTSWQKARGIDTSQRVKL